MATIELAPALNLSRAHRRRLRLLRASRRLAAVTGLRKAATPFASETGFATILLMLSDIHRAVVGAQRSSAEAPASVAAAGGHCDGVLSHCAVGGMRGAAATPGARCSDGAAVTYATGEDRTRAEAASATSDVPAPVAASGGCGDGERAQSIVRGHRGAAATSGARCSAAAPVAFAAGEDRVRAGAASGTSNVPASVAAAGGGGDGEHSHDAIGGLRGAVATSGASCSDAAVASAVGEAASDTSMAADAVPDGQLGTSVAPQEFVDGLQAGVETPEWREDELAEGCVVRVVGLLSKTQYNGKEGRLGKFIPRTGRWECNLHDGSALQIKSANIEPLSRTLENTPADTSAGAAGDMANGQRRSQRCSDACSAERAFSERDIELVRAFADCDATLARDLLREHGGNVLEACDSFAHRLLNTGSPRRDSPLL